jgi:phosphoribosylformylglycinamidine synthase
VFDIELSGSDKAKAEGGVERRRRQALANMIELPGRTALALSMKSAVLVFFGINRGATWRVPQARVRPGGRDGLACRDRFAKGTDLVVVPAGFPTATICAVARLPRAYDGCGEICGQWRPRARRLQQFRSSEAGLLPVLMRNAAEIHLPGRASAGRTIGYAVRVATMPARSSAYRSRMAKAITRPMKTRQATRGEGRVLYRYCSAEGVVDRLNINGAAQSIAGIVNGAAMCSA